MLSPIDSLPFATRTIDSNGIEHIIVKIQANQETEAPLTSSFLVFSYQLLKLLFSHCQQINQVAMPEDSFGSKPNQVPNLYVTFLSSSLNRLFIRVNPLIS